MKIDEPITLGKLRAALRSGEKPWTIEGAREIGAGSERRAYMIGPFVVKAAPYAGYHRGIYGDFPVRKAPTVKVGNWEIQRRYERAGWGVSNTHPDYLAKCERVPHYDLHAGNLAIDRLGRLVAFDW